MEVKFTLFYKLKIMVFKQCLPKQSFICCRTPSPIPMYFGELLNYLKNDSLSKLILGWGFIHCEGL